MKPKFFKTSSDFRKWLDKNSDKIDELWVGYYKKGTGKQSITWPESVDEALCCGWIDGLRKSIDEESYKIRFTPRRPNSHWSTVNINRVKELSKLGLMKPSGLEAYKKRDEKKSKQASYEQKEIRFDKKFEERIKANKKAWDYFQSMAPSYRKQCTWWIMSAKKEETKLKRLLTLIESSEQKQKIPPLRWSGKKKK